MQAKVKIFSLITTLFLILPWFFGEHPDYCFFWNVLSTLVICIFVSLCILGNRKYRRRNLFIILWFLLSIIMANHLFSYHTLISLFPEISAIPRNTLILCGMVLIFLSTLSAGIYNIYRTYTKRTLINNWMKAKLNTNISHHHINNQTVATADNPANIPTNCPASASASLIPEETKIPNTVTVSNTLTTPAVRPRAIWGSIIAVISILAIAVIIAFAILSDIIPLNTMSNQEALMSVFDYILLLAVIVLALCCFFYFTMVFIKSFYKTLTNMLQSSGTLSMDDNWILVCISIFITAFFYNYFKDATMQDFYNSMTSTEEFASLLVGLISITFMALTYHVVYRILRSFIKKEGVLRNYAKEIEQLLVKTVCELIKRVITTCSKLPDLYEMLTKSIGQAFSYLIDVLFNEDETED